VNLLGEIHKRLIYGQRVHRLSKILSQMIPPACTVLDVGAGDGRVSWLISQQRTDLSIQATDVLKRERPWLPVQTFDGTNLPYADASFDLVMLIDVLHHTLDPLRSLQEAARVARQWIVIKDHFRDGVVSGMLLRFMDYAGNSSHGVPLPYNYFSRTEWDQLRQDVSLKSLEERQQLQLYTWPVDLVFGAQLHFIGLYEKGCE
jgi:SAM-dependent methyltransferase